MAEPITDHPGLVRALRARRQALGLSQLAVDHIGGLADGYTAKIEASLSNPGANNARSIGKESLPLVLGALSCGLEIVPHRSAASTAELPSDAKALKAAGRNHHADLGRRGGRKRWLMLSEEKRKASIAALNRARVAKRRQRAREMALKAAAGVKAPASRKPKAEV